MNQTSLATKTSWPAGFAIHPRGPAIDPRMLAAFRSVPAAFVSDCLGRNIGGIGLRSYYDDAITLCGPAITVRTRPGDNLMIHKAIELAQPGDVMVVDGGGDLSQAVVGGIMRAMMMKRGLAGIVVNGAIRDIAEWRRGGLPVYALGHGHRGPSKEGPGEINVPVSCAGLLVHPGDLVLGDADGVVAVTPTALEPLLALVLAQEARENKIRSEIQSDTLSFERINSILRKKGCPI